MIQHSEQQFILYSQHQHAGCEQFLCICYQSRCIRRTLDQLRSGKAFLLPNAQGMSGHHQLAAFQDLGLKVIDTLDSELGIRNLYFPTIALKLRHDMLAVNILFLS